MSNLNFCFYNNRKEIRSLKGMLKK